MGKIIRGKPRFAGGAKAAVGQVWSVLVGRKVWIQLLALSTVVGCTPSDETAMRTLRHYGMTEIRLRGWTPFGCSRDDGLHESFSAKDARGQVVEGVLCCGLVFKACTVRFE